MKPLIAGNWKMHLDRAGARALAATLARGIPTPLESADVALFPPFTALAEVVQAVAGTDITVGGQNLYPEDQGAFTGEISGPMLLDCGATRVLVGHSERRHVMGEDDEFCNRKVHAALGHDIEPCLCVGEQLGEREAGETEAVVERQLRAGLQGVGADRAPDLTVAYEPVWAIGTGLTATPKQVAEVHAFLRQILIGLWGETGQGIRILYGGSVKPANAAALLATPDVNGALVGGASLQPESFAAIVSAAE